MYRFVKFLKYISISSRLPVSFLKHKKGTRQKLLLGCCKNNWLRSERVSEVPTGDGRTCPLIDLQKAIQGGLRSGFVSTSMVCGILHSLEMDEKRIRNDLRQKKGKVAVFIPRAG